MKRLFIAIALPASVNAALSGLLPPTLSDKGFRLVPSANRHVTVLFLGDTYCEDLPLLRYKLSAIAAQFVPFVLHITGIEAIVRNNVPNMIWATILPCASYSLLADLVGEVMGQEPDQEPLPHITLARIKDIAVLPKEWTKNTFPAPLALPVKRIEIWESVLDKGGAQYQNIGYFDLLG